MVDGGDVADLIMILVWRSDPISISRDSYSFEVRAFRIL